MSDLERWGESPTAPVGKAMTVAGLGTIGVSLMASLIPFVATVPLAAVVFLLGLYFWVK
jgi:nitrate/nitrite transporter NarK